MTWCLSWVMFKTLQFAWQFNGLKELTQEETQTKAINTKPTRKVIVPITQPNTFHTGERKP